MTLMLTYNRARHFDGTGEKISAMPRLYDGRRPAGYGGVPERRELSGTCIAIREAKAYSAAHPRTRVTVYAGGIVREYRAGVRQ